MAFRNLDTFKNDFMTCKHDISDFRLYGGNGGW